MKGSDLLTNAYKHFHSTRNAMVYIPAEWSAEANLPENLEADAAIIFWYTMKKGINIDKIDWTK